MQPIETTEKGVKNAPLVSYFFSPFELVAVGGQEFIKLGRNTCQGVVRHNDGGWWLQRGGRLGGRVGGVGHVFFFFFYRVVRPSAVPVPDLSSLYRTPRVHAPDHRHTHTSSRAHKPLTMTSTLPIPRQKQKRHPFPGPATAAALLVAAAAVGGAVRKHAPTHPHTPPPPPPALRGPFPPACAWSWEAETGYRFIRGRGRRGGAPKTRPSACDLSPRLPLPASASSSLTTSASCDASACTYTNLWHVDGAWYALARPGNDSHGAPGAGGWGVSQHVRARRLSTCDPPAWAASVAGTSPPPSHPPSFIPGTTALLDYRYFLHPTAIGHWAEHALSLAAALRGGGGGDRRPVPVPVPVARLIILHASRRHAAGEWVRTALAAAFRAGGGGEHDPPLLPPLHFQADAAAAEPGLASSPPDPASPPPLLTPPGARLEGAPPAAWLLFERVVVPRDPPTGTPAAAVVGTDAARAFRAAFWGVAGVGLPGGRGGHSPRPSSPPAPPAILFLAKAANRRVLGGARLRAALVEGLNGSSLAVAAFTAATPVRDQLEALRGASLVIGPHTSALAVAALLPPRSALLELIPFGWGWGGLDAVFSAMAAALGDVRHGAWRAGARAQAGWADGRDAARFGGWAGGECGSEGCVEAVTRGDLVVGEGVGEVVRVARELVGMEVG